RDTVFTVLLSNLANSFIQGIPPGYMSFGKRQDVPCQRVILFILRLGTFVPNNQRDQLKEAACAFICPGRIKQFLDYMPLPAVCSVASLDIHNRVCKRNAAFSMHPCATRSGDEVMKIPNFDALHTLVDTGNNEIPDWKIYALRQCGGANNEPHEVFT